MPPLFVDGLFNGLLQFSSKNLLPQGDTGKPPPPSRSHAVCVSAWHALMLLCVENRQSRFAAEAPAAAAKILFFSPKRQKPPQRSEITRDPFLKQTTLTHVKPINPFNDCHASDQM